MAHIESAVMRCRERDGRMSLHTTMGGDRLQIVLLGKRNAGKSSVLNALTGQPLAIVSDMKGTTTDPVSKAMEILPLGPCMITDTPGLDDEGSLGRMRVDKAVQALNRADMALVVMDINALGEGDQAGERKLSMAEPGLSEAEQGLPDTEREIVARIKEKGIPYVLILNQADRMEGHAREEIRRRLAGMNPQVPVILMSAATGAGVSELKDAMIGCLPREDKELHIVSDLIGAGDILVLVVPVDSAAPKGRLIMPQQQVIRDILDHGAVAVVTQVPELANTLENLSGKVRMVITDSQAFGQVSAVVPEDIPLTSFSILFARHKGNLRKLVAGARAVEDLRDGDRVLIAEGCTHHRQCEDIGTVKIPRWLREHSGKDLRIDTCSGCDFPSDLSEYRMVIHCGGCTLHEREMRHRIFLAEEQGVPMVNYGIFIAYVNGIVERSVRVFPEGELG